MHPNLRAFLRQLAAVVCAALVPVVLTTFVSIPMTLGVFPGTEPVAAQQVERHLT